MDPDTARQHLGNLDVTQQELANIAEHYPELRAEVAVHPLAYPDLVAWIEEVSGIAPELSTVSDEHWASRHWRRTLWMWVVGFLIPVIAFPARALLLWDNSPGNTNPIENGIYPALGPGDPLLVQSLLLLGCATVIVAVSMSPAKTSIRVTAICTVVVHFILVSRGDLARVLMKIPFPGETSVSDLLLNHALLAGVFVLLLQLLGTVIAFLLCRFTKPRLQPTPRTAALRASANLVPVMIPATVPGGEPHTAYISQAPRNNVSAILALVFGLIGGSVISIVFGHVALSQIKRDGDRGYGMAVAGLILGYFWLAALIGYLIWVSTFVSNFN